MIYNWPEDGVIELPGVHNSISSARMLDGKSNVPFSKPTRDVVRLEVPPQAPDPVASVITIKYEGDLQADRYEPRVEASSDKSATVGH